jgi:disulfide bond formation protein DsbB
MTHEVTVTIAVLGLVGLVVCILLAGALLLRVAGVPGPFESVQRLVWGYELWLAFAVAGGGAAASLYYSEVANFVPCELCWYQRVFLFPLALLTLLLALANDHRAARYLLPLAGLGGAVAGYHLLVENGVVRLAQACLVSAPGGCATKWIDEFGFVTIPTLALIAFALVFAFLLFAVAEPPCERAVRRAGTVEAHA